MIKKITKTAVARRKWSDDEKLSILGQIGVDGASITDVAHRHGLPSKRFYQWRASLRRKGLWSDDGPVFLVAEIEAAPPVAAQHMTIILRNGRSIGFDSNTADDFLVRLIRLAEAA